MSDEGFGIRPFRRACWPVSAIGYGMWGMAGWTGSDDEESHRSLDRAVELGCNFFDTAFAYGEGRSERLLGALVRESAGQRIYTATKIPPRNRRWPSARGDTLDDAYPPEHVEAYLRRSLENLGLPRVDLIQLHTWQDAWLADPRLARMIAKLRADGLCG